LNSSAKRLPPNWLVCCWLNTEFSLLWIVDAGVEGSKTLTLGPRSGVPAGGGSVGGVVPPDPRVNDWAAVPLQAYCWTRAPLAVDAAATSRHLPLLRLTKW
jgi:hypothetical protein